MKAAWFTEKGEASKVLKVGTLNEIEPQPGEVQIEILFSGINPGDIVKRIFMPGNPMPYPLIIPHSDGAGYVRKVGGNVSATWIGKKVCCFGAQSYRPYGTAAEFCCVPLNKVIELTEGTPLIQAAQMGIPAVTGHRAVHVLNAPLGKTILVQGGAGAVGQCAIQFAKLAGATVLATVTRKEDVDKAFKAGASDVFILQENIIDLIKEKYPDKVDHIVEVSFSKNLSMDLGLLKVGGSIATYSGDSTVPPLPFWQLIFDNISFHFLGSDDFNIEDKRSAMEEAIKALDEGWTGLEIGEIFPLADIAKAHEYVENKQSGKRAIITLKE